MARKILIYGESGTGKSTSIKHLDHKTTFVIRVDDKELPFGGHKKKYITKTKENDGNMFCTDNANSIISVMKNVNELPHIKTLVIDDFQYLMSNEYMRRANEKDFTRFTDIAQNVWKILEEPRFLREDLNIFVLSHSEADDNTGKTKMKTVGKMLDRMITLEGKFTIVLYSMINKDQEFVFLTQNNGLITAKSPEGMFDSQYIPNNLQYVIDRVEAHSNLEEVDIDQ